MANSDQISTRRYIREAVAQGSIPSEEATMHAYHCLNLIREEIMCTATDGLVAANLDASHTKRLRLGQFETRQCTNWAFLRDWTVLLNSNGIVLTGTDAATA